MFYRIETTDLYINLNKISCCNCFTTKLSHLDILIFPYFKYLIVFKLSGFLIKLLCWKSLVLFFNVLCKGEIYTICCCFYFYFFEFNIGCNRL